MEKFEEIRLEGFQLIRDSLQKYDDRTMRLLEYLRKKKIKKFRINGTEQKIEFLDRNEKIVEARTYEILSFYMEATKKFEWSWYSSRIKSKNKILLAIGLAKYAMDLDLDNNPINNYVKKIILTPQYKIEKSTHEFDIFFSIACMFTKKPVLNIFHGDTYEENTIYDLEERLHKSNKYPNCMAYFLL